MRNETIQWMNVLKLFCILIEQHWGDFHTTQKYPYIYQIYECYFNIGACTVISSISRTYIILVGSIFTLPHTFSLESLHCSNFTQNIFTDLNRYLVFWRENIWCAQLGHCIHIYVYNWISVKMFIILFIAYYPKGQAVKME